MSKIAWFEVENSSGLISAMSSLDYYFRQFYADAITAMFAIVEHSLGCEICQKAKHTETESDCEQLKNLLTEIGSRFERHKGFLDSLETLKGISSWYKPSPGEPSIMHELNSVIDFYTPTGSETKTRKRKKNERSI